MFCIRNLEFSEFGYTYDFKEEIEWDTELELDLNVILNYNIF